MQCGKQEALYFAFIFIVLGGAMLYWYTNPTYGMNGPLKPITFAQQFQYWGAFFILAVAAVTVFLAAYKHPHDDLNVNMISSPSHHYNHHTPQPGFLI